MAADKDTGKDMALGLGAKVGAQSPGAVDQSEDDDARELRIAQEVLEATQRKIQERKAAKAKEEQEQQRLLEEAARKERLAAAGRIRAGGGSRAETSEAAGRIRAGGSSRAETSEEPEDTSISSVMVVKLPDVPHQFAAVDVGIVIVDKYPEYKVGSRLLACKKEGIEVELLVLEVGRFFDVFDATDKL